MRRSVSIAAMLACTVILPALPSRCDAQTTARPPLSPAQRAASDPRVYQAQQEVEKKNYARAVELLTGFLKDFPNDATAHFQLGYVYGILKRSDDSISEYRRAAELKPDFAEAHLNLGLALLDAKDFSGAGVALRRAAELTPAQAKLRYLAGFALERSDKIPEAIAEYEAAATLDQNNFDTFLHWGIVLLRANRLEDAEKRLRQAIVLRGDGEAAHSALIDVLLREKKTDEAIVELRTFLQRNSDDPRARLKLATALYDTGKPADALAELDRADAGSAPSAERARLRASILISQQNWDGAARALAIAVAAAPDDAALHAEYGRILLQQRDFPAAKSELRKSLALDGKQNDVLRNLVSTEYLAGNYNGTLELLDILAKRETPLPIVLFVRATCYDKLQRKPEAVEAYQKFLAADNGRSDKEEFQASERLKVLQKELTKK
jgi:tetratricopeptide (TPR) repeat protein